MEKTKIIATNKKVYRDFDVLESVEAGIELKGYEAQSARRGYVGLNGAYVRESNGELFIYNLFIAKNASVHDSFSEKRKRKVLLHRNEIIKWSSKIKERGLTILPLDVHIENNRVKLTVALVKRKKLFGDKKKLEEKIIKEEARRFKKI